MTRRIALLVGHTDKQPGFCVGDWREYDYTHRVGELVAEHWAGWVDGCVIDSGHDRASTSSGITENLVRAYRWGGPQCATMEIHANANAKTHTGPSDYMLTLYRAGDEIARQLCEHVRSDLWALVGRYGVERSITVGLPHRLWPRYGAVMDSHCHAAILEPAFRTRIESAAFWYSPVIEEYALTLSRSLRQWAECGGVI